MTMIRIAGAEALGPHQLRLKLTDGRIIVRNVADLLLGPLFERVRTDAAFFARVTVEGGTVAWPNGADLCPDVLIWGGAPPETGAPAEREQVSSKA